MLARAPARGKAIAGADNCARRRYITVARPVRAFGVARKVTRTMTGSARSSDGLDLRRRKLLYHAWHRGMREMDLIMGRFADAALDELTEAELAEFEQLIEVPDRERPALADVVSTWKA